jgi:opacity protein-like surface antigen
MARLILFSAILVFAGVVPVLAQEDDYARKGIYAGISMAGTSYLKVEDDVKDDFEPSGFGYSGGTDTDDPLGLGVQVGYRFHPHFSAEAGFLWFSSSETEFSGEQFPDPADPNGEITDANNLSVFKLETLNLTGNLKGYLLTGRIQPFVLVGGGLMHANVDDKFDLGTISGGSAFAARFGGGVEFYVISNIAVVVDLDYVLPTGKLDRLNQFMWSVGLNYRF